MKEKQMVYVEICYDCGCFTTARTAIIPVIEREGYTFTSDYFEEAKKTPLHSREYYEDLQDYFGFCEGDFC